MLPDFTRETFAPVTEHGGHDPSDGRALRYLEWLWDPDAGDDTCLTDYAFVLRSPDGNVSAVHDRHVEGRFARKQWLAWLAEAGFRARSERDRWSRDVFLGTRSAPGPAA